MSTLSILDNPYPLGQVGGVGLQFSSITEQVAAHLRDGLARGQWTGTMPGRDALAANLGVSPKTVQRALEMLEEAGMLGKQGAGRRRRITLSPRLAAARPLRVAILLGEAADRRSDYQVELRHELAEAGHAAVYPPKGMEDLGMEVKRIARMVERVQADAWVVTAGSLEVLSWFQERGLPTFALFGRRRGFTMAGGGPDKPPAIAAATRRLIELGHRRIVLLVRRRRRLPHPGASEQAFLDELAEHGIVPTAYHLPDWEATMDGFHGRLEALFRVTPPSAMIVDEVPFFAAVQQFLARRCLQVPEDVSLVSTDADLSFDWCRPSVSHIRWDSAPVVSRIVAWAGNVSRGKKDLRQISTPAEFVAGGTIGPVRDR